MPLIMLRLQLVRSRLHGRLYPTQERKALRMVKPSLRTLCLAQYKKTKKLLKNTEIKRARNSLKRAVGVFVKSGFNDVLRKPKFYRYSSVLQLLDITAMSCQEKYGNTGNGEKTSTTKSSVKHSSTTSRVKPFTSSVETVGKVGSQSTREDGDSKNVTNTKPKTCITIIILFTINLLNYMDRYTIAGVLTSLQSFYNIHDAHGGLLQTMFMVFFMISSPLCGFLGDRYVRKWIMVTGISIWVFSVFASTFVPANTFWLFLLLRGMVGVGEASYAVISPSIIADMFTGTNRSRMLMFFYFAIPCGSGFGFMVGSTVAAVTGDWRWGIRVTAILGVLCLFSIIFFVKEPKRGEAECAEGAHVSEIRRTNYFEDLKSLTKNATYVFSTIAYTTIVFMVGTLTWWAPTAIEHSYAYEAGLNSTDQLSPDTKAQVNLIFGAITCTAGIVGVAMGSMLSQWLHDGIGPFRFVKTTRSDAIVCGIGAVISIPSLFFALRAIPNMTTAWVLIFICITATCFNWATNVNMLM
ncbi:hypothetical protein KIN20_032857, partial [Parelaphostrongylus tenuis]